MRSAAFVMVAAANPALVGAVWPSSRWLADAMAKAARGARLLVDLGAGTGAITAALLDRHPGVPVIAVELQAALAELLARRFPQVQVQCAGAHEALDALHADAPPDTVLVSSLPFRSLPAPWRQCSIDAITAFLTAEPRRRLVQYTYRLRAPFGLPDDSVLHWTRVGRVWRNAPPAGLWSLQRR